MEVVEIFVENWSLLIALEFMSRWRLLELMPRILNEGPIAHY